MASFSDPSGGYNPYAPPTTAHDTSLDSPADDDEVVVLAERGTRLWGRFVDDLLVGVSFIPSLFVIDDFKRDFAQSLMIMGALPLMVLCAQWYLVATTGQSLAKRWLRIKIVRLDGSPAGFVSGVLLRSWVAFFLQCVPYVGSVIGLVDSLMIFGDQRRCLHDHIAGTKVVQVFRS